MSSLLTIALAVSLSCVHTVEDQYFGGQNAEPVAEVNQKTASGSNTLDELEKDPLYPYIDKQNKLVEKMVFNISKTRKTCLCLPTKTIPCNQHIPPQI